MTTPLWSQCTRYLEQELSGQDFNTWIRPLCAVEDQQTLRLLAPNQFVLNWVIQHFQVRIKVILQRLVPDNPPKLVVQVGSRAAAPQTRTDNAQSPMLNGKSGHANQAYPHKTRLNAKLQFNNFVAGDANHLAYTAAQQVAAHEVDYNPLCIYGGVGLGKTHLMQAVGNHIVGTQPSAKVTYVHSERFVYDMVKALRSDNINAFKKYYRSLDVLLLDDVQFFANKNQSQEEFFHTFNVLLDKQKQIIITCDRPPQQIKGLNERLQSRLGSGLCLDVHPPDFTTRLAIVQRKAQETQLQLPYEVGHFIADRIRSNVRELEGALHRILATARFLHETITVDTAKKALQDLFNVEQEVLTLEKIQELVADYFKVSVDDLQSRRRQRVITRPRQIAMSLSKEFTDHSLPEIGKAFGGRDHSTVIHSCKTVTKLIAEDAQLKADYANLVKTLSKSA